MFWKKGTVVIISCKTIVRNTEKKSSLLNFKVDLPLTKKARVRWEKIKILKIIVLENISLLFCKRNEKIMSKTADKQNPTVSIKPSLLPVSICCFGFLGFSLRILLSLLSLANAKAGRPSVIKFIQSI